MDIRVGVKWGVGLVAGFLLIAGASCRLYGEQKTDSPAFEVVNIKPFRSPPPLWQLPSCRGNRFLSRDSPIRDIAQWAYGVRPFQFTGKWPSWTILPQYYIEARSSAAMNQEECKGMARALLADEFKLSLRRAQGSIDVYALLVGSKKPALRRVEADGTDDTIAVKSENWATFCDAKGPTCIRVFGRDVTPTPGITMEDLAYSLSGLVGRPVLDHTGLAGRYAFRIAYDSRPDGVGYAIFSALERQLRSEAG
jgi:uncharacterized protein (TIGR03435 family)